LKPRAALGAIAFNVTMFGSGLLMSLYGLALVRLAPSRIPALGRAWARLCLAALKLFCGIDIVIEGAEHVPAGPAIIAAQHQSALDILVWLAVLPHPAFVLKQELLKLPLFGSLLVPAGMIPVDREGAAPALRKMIADSRAALASGRQVVIFPEGTRVAPGARAPLHGGIVALTRIADVPVIPAATDSGRRWGARSFGKTPGAVRVKLFPAMPAGQRREAVIAALTECFYEMGVGIARGAGGAATRRNS